MLAVIGARFVRGSRRFVQESMSVWCGWGE